MNSNMIFRWSIWGDHGTKNLELLKYSILSFQKQFGTLHEYIVYSDDANAVSEYLEAPGVDVRQFPEKDAKYYVTSVATWKKWCPAARLDVSKTEVYVDSDVYLVKQPFEIESFLNNPTQGYAILDEFFGQSWQHGAMARKATQETPFVNAGLFIQKSGFDISQALEDEFFWWSKYIPTKEQTHHDEQGALAIALTEPLKRGELFILPKEKYMLIGPNENKEIHSLSDVTLFHAVYPHHPAFYQFQSDLNQLLGL
jgi:hypothetical protein